MPQSVQIHFQSDLQIFLINLIQMIKKPKFQLVEFSIDKEARSVNIFYYGLLLDCLFINGVLYKNVQIFVSDKDTNIICMIHFKEKKVLNRFEINILDIDGISEKPLHESNQAKMKKFPDFQYLAIQLNFKQLEKKIILNEYLFQFEYESTKRIFWQGIQSLIKKQKRPIQQLSSHILGYVEPFQDVDFCKNFILKRNPHLQIEYLNRLIEKYDIDFQDVIQNSHIIEIFQDININYELLKIFNSCTSVQYVDKCEANMTFQEFQTFQQKIQQDHPLEDVNIIQQLRKFNPDHDVRLEKLSFYDFCCFVQLENNFLHSKNIPKKNQNLKDFFVFSKFFMSSDLKESVKLTLKRGCFFFDFEIIDNNQPVPFFKIKNQTCHAFDILIILVEHVGTSDFPVLVNFNCKCTNEQQLELYQLIEKRASKNILRDSNLQFSNLVQKIIFMGSNVSNSKLQSILFPEYALYSYEEAQDQLNKSAKLVSDTVRSGIHYVKGKQFQIIDFSQTGFQIISQDGQNLENLLYISQFQTSTEKFNFMIEKPSHLIQAPFKYSHLDFNKIKQNFSLHIISGFQIGADNIYLEISIRGLKQDYQQNNVYQSCIIENGFKPVFNQTVSFELRCPELAQVLIQVYKKTYFEQDELISWVAFGALDIKKGTRRLNLRNLEFEWIENSYLLINNAS